MMSTVTDEIIDLLCRLHLAGWQDVQIARHLDVSAASVCRWRQGERRPVVQRQLLLRLLREAVQQPIPTPKPSGRPVRNHEDS